MMKNRNKLDRTIHLAAVISIPAMMYAVSYLYGWRAGLASLVIGLVSYLRGLADAD